jgi:hypothetical protein
MPRTQSSATIVKHLKSVLRKIEDCDISSIPEDNALRAAIEIVKGADKRNRIAPRGATPA